MDSTARREFEQTALPLVDNLYRAAMRLCSDRNEAEDLVQDTLVRAYRFWAGFKRGSNAKAWLFTILRNTFINRYHKQGRIRALSRDVAIHMSSHDETAAVGYSQSAPLGPDTAVARERERSHILAALDTLVPDYRLAVTLADLEGMSYKEIAEIMDCPIGTVMSRIFRGRRALYALLRADAVEAGLLEEEPAEAVSLTDYRSQRRKNV